MKNILIHCAMEKEGEQIAKFLELSKVQKYDTNLKNNSIKESKEKFNKTDINNFIEVYSNKVNNFLDVYPNDKNSNLENVENNIYTENKTKMSLLITGIGKQKTAIGLTKYLCENDKPDLIINIGYAGSTNAKIGSWVSINKSYNLEWDITGEQKYSMDDLGGQDLVTIDELEKLPCYSAECFVNNTDIKDNVIFDMELHSVSLLADLYNIPLISLKKVSDNLSMDDYYKTVEDNRLMELESSVIFIEKFLKDKLQNIYCSLF